MLGVIGVLLALALLVLLAYKGWGMIPVSLICSLVVIITNGQGIWSGIYGNYGEGLKFFIGAYFIMILLGSLFGKVMADSGCASSIAYKLLDIFGTSKAILAVVLATAILSYSGVNAFIVIFTAYPIGLIAFKTQGLPKRLLMASISLGFATFTLTCLPASPSINNVIASSVLNTPTTAAPVVGIIGAIVMFGLGYTYLRREEKKAKAAGETFIPGPKDDIAELEVTAEFQSLPDWKIAILPMITVLGLIIGFRKMDPTFVVSMALVAGVIVIYLFNWKRFESPLKTLTEGFNQGLVPLINTGAVVAFGFVVQKAPAFAEFTKFALGLKFNPLISAGISTNIMAGVTGSSSGGLAIFLNTMGPEYLKLGVTPELLHRISVIASGGLDSLPHSGAIITMLAVMQLTHKEAYRDTGIITVLIPIITLIVVTAISVLFM